MPFQECSRMSQKSSCASRFINIFRFMEIYLRITCISRLAWNFLTTFWHTDQRFRRNILQQGNKIDKEKNQSNANQSIVNATIYTIKFELKSSYELKSLWLHFQSKIETLMLMIIVCCPYGQILIQRLW